MIKAVDRGFREMYFTLISIIQGVAFGFLAERIFTATRKPTPEQWIAFTICFMVIVTVWHDYMIGSTVFAWTPTLLDSVIPFAIGMTEFQLIAGATLGADTFLARLAIFLTIGIAAYLNWEIHAKRGATNKARYPVLKPYILFGTIYCSATTVFTFGLSQGIATGIDLTGAPLLAVTLGVVTPLFVHSAINWNLKLHLIRAHIPDEDSDHGETPTGWQHPYNPAGCVAENRASTSA